MVAQAVVNRNYADTCDPRMRAYGRQMMRQAALQAMLYRDEILKNEEVTK